MGTTNQTTGSNTSALTFNPQSQNLYNQLTSAGGGILSGYMNAPFSNPFFNLGAGQSQKGAQQAGQNNMAAVMQNQKALGLGGQAGQGWLGAQMAKTGRANQAMSSQANTSNVLSALQRQMSAAGTGLSFSPQLTGQSGNFSQTQTQSGLGTWLPQLMSAGLGAAMGGMGGGGLSSLFANPTINAGSPSYMPGGGSILPPSFAGMGSSGLQGMLPGMGNPLPPMLPGMNYGGNP